MTDKPITITADDGTKVRLYPTGTHSGKRLYSLEVTGQSVSGMLQGAEPVEVAPVAQEEKVEKHRYRIRIYNLDTSPRANDLYEAFFSGLTGPTAQALADATKALVEYVQLSEGAKQDVEAGSYANLFVSVGNAKKAFQREQS